MIFETVLGYKASWRILELLAESPLKSISRKEIKDYTQLGNESINSALKRLTISEILIKEKEGKKESYYFNLSNEFTKKILDIIKYEHSHLKNIPFDSVILLSEFTRKLLEKTNFIDKIFLFGSVAKGTARVDSDVDLALITTKKDLKQELAVTQIMEDINELFKRKIQVHYFTKEEFKSSTSSLIREVKKDGIDVLAHHKKLIE